MHPRVVWPAPGYPQVCIGDNRVVRVIVAHHDESDLALHNWAKGLQLTYRQAGDKIPLAVDDISRHSQPSEISGLMALPECRGLRYTEIRLRAGHPIRIAG